MSEQVNYKQLASALRDFIPDGDGYNSEYAHTLSDCADAIDALQAEVRTLKKQLKESSRDTGLGAAIQSCCRDLPEGFVLELSLEKDGSDMALHAPNTDATYDEFDGDTLAEQILYAVETAKSIERGDAYE